MIARDKERFTQIMYGLAENFSAELTLAGIDFKFRALSKFTIEQIEAAANVLVFSRKYTKMPTVADFVESIEGHASDHAQVEGARVLDAIRKHGSYESIDFQDPVTHAVLAEQFGGWVKLCTTLQEKDEKFFLHDFERAYIAYTREGREHPRHLPGQHEINNAQFPKHIPKPVRIPGARPRKQIAAPVMPALLEQDTRGDRS